MRFPAKYEKLIENLELFTKVNKNNKYFKDVRLSSVICKTTLPELALHFEVYGKYIPITNMGFGLINSLAPTNNFFDKDKILTKHLNLCNPCDQIFGTSHHILANGDVTPCCRDYNGEIIVGNVFKEKNFDSIINSKKAVDLRQEQLEGKNAQDLLCANCYNVDKRVRMMWDRFFESVRYHYLYNNKSIAQIQSKVDNFFNAFEEEIPNLKKFTELFDFENYPSMNY